MCGTTTAASPRARSYRTPSPTARSCSFTTATWNHTAPRSTATRPAGSRSRARPKAPSTGPTSPTTAAPTTTRITRQAPGCTSTRLSEMSPAAPAPAGRELARAWTTTATSTPSAKPSPALKVGAAGSAAPHLRAPTPYAASSTHCSTRRESVTAHAGRRRERDPTARVPSAAR